MGLESLNENLPEIKAELVFTQKQLQVWSRVSYSGYLVWSAEA